MGIVGVAWKGCHGFDIYANTDRVGCKVQTTLREKKKIKSSPNYMPSKSFGGMSSVWSNMSGYSKLTIEKKVIVFPIETCTL